MSPNSITIITMTALLKDPALMDGLTLGATFAARELIVKRRMSSLGEVGSIVVSQTVYDKFLDSYASALVGGFTGEKYWSGLLANAAGLAVVLYSFRKSGLISRGSEDLGDGALLPSPSSPMLSSLMEAGELLIEKSILEALLAKSGYAPAATTVVVPTTVTSSGLI
jgi:hypothetical protein